MEVVKGCRKIGKKDMKYNDIMPKMKVDPERYVSHAPFWILNAGVAPYFVRLLTYVDNQTVHADGVICEAEPATSLPLTQQYFVY